VADQKIKDMMIEAAIETEATSASPLYEFRSHGLQLLLRWSTISNEAAFGTAYFILWPWPGHPWRRGRHSPMARGRRVAGAARQVKESELPHVEADCVPEAHDLIVV
jgi:hypothetical protein